MSGKNQVTLTFAGETKSLEAGFDRVGAASKRMEGDVETSVGGIDRVGESADNAEGRFTGLASGIDGVTTLMDDPSPQEFAQGIADIADGIANAAVPAISKMVTWTKTSMVSTAQAAAGHVAAAATTVAGWVAMGIAAMVNAVKMAAAWLISLGPIALVILAIMAIIGVLAYLGVGFDDVKAIAAAVWGFILGVIQGAFNWLKSNWPLVLAILTGPFGLAVLAIVRNWDTIKAAVGGAMGFVRDAVTGAKDWVVARFNDLVGFVTGMPGRISSAASGMFNGIKDAARNAINGVISMWNNLSFTLPKINIPSVDVPGLGKIGGGSFGGQTFSTPNIPTLHTGGIYKAPRGQREGLAMLLDGEKVSRPGDSGQGVTVNVYVSGSIRSERDLVDVIEKAIARGDIRTAAA